MNEARVNYRYAKALYDMSAENNSEVLVLNDMYEIVYTYLNVPEFKRFLNNPAVSPLKKVSIIHTIFQESFTKLTLSFFSLITRKTRLSYILGIAKAFIDIYRKEKNITHINILTASELDDETKSAIQQVLDSKISIKTIYSYKTNPDIIGGVKITFNEKEYDATISYRLQSIRKDFSENLMKAQL
ncbi:ATP synthase subunit delta [Bacteroidia bacterium]|nr:ATP synthase subunit delta [Bacteroidia bacterium]